MLGGEAGIGKTTLWEAGADLARELGLRVLVARPSGAEARLSFAALIDLFEGVTCPVAPAPGGACTRSSTDRSPALRDRSLSHAAA